MTTDEDTRGDLQELKKTLMHQAGLLWDPLTVSQSFMLRRQTPGEKVSDFAVDLKRLFIESYPGEQTTSTILLQRFWQDFCQLFLVSCCSRIKPTSLDRAVQDASDIEFALTFEAPQEELQDVNVVHHKSTPTANDSPTLQSGHKVTGGTRYKSRTASKQPRYYPTQQDSHSPMLWIKFVVSVGRLDMYEENVL